jgi:hypothetical protein
LPKRRGLPSTIVIVATTININVSVNGFIVAVVCEFSS